MVRMTTQNEEPENLGEKQQTQNEHIQYLVLVGFALAVSVLTVGISLSIIRALWLMAGKVG